VRWEDVKFVAKDEDEDDEDDNDQDDFNLGRSSAPPVQHEPPQEACQQCAPEVCESPVATEGGNKDVSTDDEKPPTDDADHDRPQCENIWMTSIKPQMEDIILTSLRCVSDSVQHRKNTTELFGYDFMLSTDGNSPKVWLIEVNSSPACDYSTPVTCPLVKQMMEDTAKVMVDLRENPDAPTGEWEFIHHEHNKFIPCKKNCPINLEVCGSRIKRPKGWKKKKRKKKGAASVGLESTEQEDEDAGEDNVDDEGDDSAGGGAESESDS